MSIRLSLIPHPDFPCALERIDAEVSWGAGDGGARTLHVRFVAQGADELVVPAAQAPSRTDGLWQTTCFELFLRPRQGESYVEFNFSPSGQWAAYGFDGYRAGMHDLELRGNPRVKSERMGDDFGLEVELDLAGVSPELCRMSLSAVIEARDGRKSYWAIAHPPGKPDFHHPDCFARELPAPERA